jgi:hypothetical protein
MKRSLSNEAIDDLAALWAHALQRGEEAADDDVHTSVVVLTFTYTPVVQWQFILAAVRHALPEDLGAVAAGPFEGLMGRHGEEYIEQVEDEAVRDPKFREMVRGSWQHMMSDEIWARVQAVQALPLQ